METIETFRYLMSRANDIYNNRIEKVLREMDSVMLYTLPTNEAWYVQCSNGLRYIYTIRHMRRCRAA
jgi:hypothetical protein